MPEVVLAYRETRLVRECQDVLSDLIVTFRDDFAKYRTRVPTSRLEEVFESIPRQAGGKFVYARVNPAAHSLALREALDLLVKAGLAYQIVHSDARGTPLGAQTNPKRFKMGLVDVGLHQRLLGLDLAGQLTATGAEVANRGAIAELVAAQELRCHAPWREPARLHYWHREARSSNAEVDFVAVRRGEIIPIEVKSGRRGGMQSLRVFMQDRGLQHGLRSSLEPFGRIGNVDVVPLYALGVFMTAPP
jgi:predicted AAA+ superfamily ATPase